MICSFLIVSREPPRLAVVIAATGQRHQSGDGVLMGLEPYAMLVVYVRLSFPPVLSLFANRLTDYAKLTRKMGKPPQNGSNIRPKEMRQGSP